jgi:hypothetical protein
LLPERTLQLRSFDLAKETAMLGVMKVDVADIGILEATIDAVGHASALDHFGVNHHVHVVVSSQRDEAGGDVWGDAAWGLDALLHALADEDRARRSVRRIRCQVREGQQEQFVADLCIREAHPTWEAGLAIRDDPTDALIKQFLIAELEQVRELDSGQAGESESVHGDARFKGRAPMVRCMRLERSPYPDT